MVRPKNTWRKLSGIMEWIEELDWYYDVSASSQAFRTDPVIVAAQLFVGTALSQLFMPTAKKELEFARLLKENKISTLLCSELGFDTFSRVDNVTENLNNQISSIIGYVFD